MSRLLFVVICALTICLATASELDNKRICLQRTGLKEADIVDVKTRNEKCSLDCITKQGTILTAYAPDGTHCHDDSGYNCIMGKCYPSEANIDEEIREGLNQIEITIQSAFVADRDPYPTQGESDVFVVVELVSGGGPSYYDGEILCHTHVVQDNSRPRWNFACRPPPIKGAAKLRFIVLDSDKPDTNPQLLGKTVQRVDALMNMGTQNITLDHHGIAGGPYWLNLDITGTKYNPNDWLH